MSSLAILQKYLPVKNNLIKDRFYCNSYILAFTTSFTAVMMFLFDVLDDVFLMAIKMSQAVLDNKYIQRFTAR